jgi:hypothetical protein
LEANLIDQVEEMGTYRAMTISPISGGQPEESLEKAIYLAPKLYAANDRIVRLQDYKAHIMKFSDCIDCKVWNEYIESLSRREINLKMMNKIYYSVLPNSLSLKTNIPIVVDNQFSLGSSVFPGSCVINTLNRIYEGGTGYLLDNISYVNCFTVNNFSISANQNSPMASNLFNPDERQYYASEKTIDLNAPLVFKLENPNSKTVYAIKLIASDIVDCKVRNTPLQVLIVGSNDDQDIDSSNPSIKGDILLKNYNIPQLKQLEKTKWFFLNIRDNDNNPKSYSYYYIVFSSAEFPAVSTIGKLQGAALEEGANTIDYETGNVVLNQAIPNNTKVLYLSGQSNIDIKKLETYILSKAGNILLENQQLVCVPIFFKFKIYLDNKITDVNGLKLEINNLLQDYFKLKIDCLGSEFFLMDLIKQIKSLSFVKDIAIYEPEWSIKLQSNEFLFLYDYSFTMEMIN